MSRAAEILHGFWRFVLTMANLAACVALPASAYAGYLNPAHYPYAGVAVLMLPVCLAALCIVLIVDILAARRMALWAALSLVVSLGPVYDLAPINFTTPKTEGKPEWTLLTYNVGNFTYGKSDSDSLNHTLSYILSTNADVVCLQEDIAMYGLAYARTQLNNSQLDSLYGRYPYYFLSTHAQTLLSRFPTKALYDTQFCTAYEINIYGQRVALFNVHLKSLSLTDSDRELYTDITGFKKTGRGTRGTVRALKSDLVGKISRAYALRAEHCRALIELINKYGGENVVVTGDFNDVPGCWTLHQLADIGLHEVYPTVGTGYRYTFNRSRLYFRIDHMLWRGHMTPLSLDCARVPYSDHYPQLASFAINN